MRLLRHRHGDGVRRRRRPIRWPARRRSWRPATASSATSRRPSGTSLGRHLFFTATRFMEARTRALVDDLAHDPRLSAKGSSARPLVARIAKAAIRNHVPGKVVQAIARPEAARRRAQRAAQDALALGDRAGQRRCRGPARPRRARALDGGAARPVRHHAGGGGRAALAGAGDAAARRPGDARGGRAGGPGDPPQPDDRDGPGPLGAGAPPAGRRGVRAGARQPDAGRRWRRRTGAAACRPRCSRGWPRFLATWGCRGVAEIDLGLPRWEEDPTHILGVLANYQRLDDLTRAPDTQFAEAAAQAEQTIDDAGPARGTTRRPGRPDQGGGGEGAAAARPRPERPARVAEVLLRGGSARGRGPA